MLTDEYNIYMVIPLQNLIASDLRFDVENKLEIMANNLKKHNHNQDIAKQLSY